MRKDRRSRRICRPTSQASPQRRSADFARDHAGAEGERKRPASFPPEGKIGNDVGARGRLPLCRPRARNMARTRRSTIALPAAASGAFGGRYSKRSRRLPSRRNKPRWRAATSRFTAAPAADKGRRISGDWALILSLPKDQGRPQQQIHAIVDADRSPWVLVLTPVNTADRIMAREWVSLIPGSKDLLADPFGLRRLRHRCVSRLPQSGENRAGHRG